MAKRGIAQATTHAMDNDDEFGAASRVEGTSINMDHDRAVSDSLQSFLAELDALFTDGDDSLVLTSLSALESASSALAKAKTPKTKSKSSGQRQKVEMQRLRGEVIELDAQLQALKRRRELEHNHLQGATSGKVSWEGVVKRQRKERCLAEIENAQLIGALQAQIKLVRRLEKMLDDRQLAQLHPGEWSQLDEVQGEDDARVFLELVQSVDGRYPLLDTVMRTCGLDSVTKDTKGVWTAHGLSSSGISFEHRCCKVFPFASELVGDVMWQSLRQGKVKGGNDHVKIVKESSDLVLSKTIAHEPSASNEPVTIYQVAKRFTGRSNTNVVWESTTMVPGEAFASQSPFQVTTRGWVRLLPARLGDGSIGAVAHEVKTMALTCDGPVLGSPRETQSGKPLTAADRAVAHLITLLPMLVDKKEAQAHQAVENVLLDASIAASRA